MGGTDGNAAAPPWRRHPWALPQRRDGVNQMHIPLRASAWKYGTAAGGGLAFGLLAGSGGSSTLISPAGEYVVLRYAGGGLGSRCRRQTGAARPRHQSDPQDQGRSTSGTGASEDFTSRGLIFIADSIAGRDLTISDFRGPCVYVELSTGLIAGGSGTGMLFGLDPTLFALVGAVGATTVRGGGYPTAKLWWDLVTRLFASARGLFVSVGVMGVRCHSIQVQGFSTPPDVCSVACAKPGLK